MERTDSLDTDHIDRHHIFVVNDSLEILDVLRELLEGEHYAVTTAVFAANPFDQIYATQPSVLIVDLPPGGAGWELLERLDGSPQTREIPVIATATDPDNLDELVAYATHRRIAGMLLKPFDLAELLGLVADASA